MSEEKTFESAIATALDPERMLERVERSLNDAIDRWMRDSLNSFNSPVRKAFEKRIEEILVPSIERMSLDNARIDLVLSRIVNEAGVETRAKVADNLGTLLLGPRREVILASELFDAYKRYVAGEYDCDGRNVVFEDEPTYEDLTCVVEFDEQEDPWYGRHSVRKDGTLTFSITDSGDEEQEAKLYRSVRLWRWDGYPHDPCVWFASYPTQPTFKSLARMGSFDVLLARLDSDMTMIRWDVAGNSDMDCVTPDATPECDWS